MVKERMTLTQLLNPNYHFNLIVYLEKGVVKFNFLDVLQLTSLLYPYFKKFKIKDSQIIGDRAILVLTKGDKRMYLEIEIVKN